MGLFSRQREADDMRDRDYVLTGCPVVAQDDMIVLVDLTVRLAVRPRDDEGLVLGYNAADEPAVHAVCVLVLRQLGARVPSDELLVGRPRVVEAVEQGLRLAPIWSGVDARVMSVEVRPHDPDGVHFRHEFRLTAGA